MPEFTFDPEAHIYRLGSKALPSVTQVMKDAGLYRYLGGDTRHLTLGRHVHSMTELHDTGELDEDSLDEILVPYLDAYKRFLSESGFTPILIEQPLYHPALLYAGTIDRHGDLNAEPATIDIKSGAPYPASDIQVSGYRELLRANDYPTGNCYALHLKDTGRYTLIKYQAIDRGLTVFMAALTIAHWKEAHL